MSKSKLKPESERDWTGYTVIIPEQHDITITGLWKKEVSNIWWWKCSVCIHGSGTINSSQLERLDKKDMIEEPGYYKIPSDSSKHPAETDGSDDYYYNLYGMGY